MAWTVVETVEEEKWGPEGKLFVLLKIACTADAGAKTYVIENFAKISGMFLYAVVTVPGSGADAPSAAYTLDIEDQNAFHLMDLDSVSTSATAWNLGTVTLTQYPVLWGRPQLVFNTAIGTGNKTTVYLFCVK